jgi:hypothetical protein
MPSEATRALSDLVGDEALRSLPPGDAFATLEPSRGGARSWTRVRMRLAFGALARAGRAIGSGLARRDLAFQSHYFNSNGSHFAAQRSSDGRLEATTATAPRSRVGRQRGGALPRGLGAGIEGSCELRLSRFGVAGRPQSVRAPYAPTSQRSQPCGVFVARGFLVRTINALTRPAHSLRACVRAAWYCGLRSGPDFPQGSLAPTSAQLPASAASHSVLIGCMLTGRSERLAWAGAGLSRSLLGTQ